ncbi:MAG TPA: hypothetical protein VKB12_17745 [Pyrinomonadaceae bacterium]|nr:hypothetical protein [Pyrinomonadaceae bacterium]
MRRKSSPLRPALFALSLFCALSAAPRSAQNIRSELIKDFPKDPDNDYLSYMRFKAGGNTYVVRFTWPCT